MKWKKYIQILVISIPVLFLFFQGYIHRWNSEDAFISFRVVDNLISGYGPVYNIDERVEAYTHPLWIAILSLSAKITKSIELSAVWLGLIFSCIGLLFGIIGGNYKGIFNYFVDFEGNVYIANDAQMKIDKFDPEGKFVVSYGRAGEGPGEFPYVPPFCVDSKGKLYAFPFPLGKIIVFNKDGKFIENISLPRKYWDQVAVKAEPTINGKIIIVFSNHFIFNFVLFSPETKTFKFLREDKKRFSAKVIDYNLLPKFVPDVASDSQGRIYITDSCDYKIYIYNNHGEYIKTFESRFKKEKINPSKEYSAPDLEDREEFKEAKKIFIDALKNTDGNLKYFPAIIGMNIDDGKIFIWTSKVDENVKYIIDVYSTDFKLLKRISSYNYMHNKAYIRNGFFYIPNPMPDMKGYGRLGLGHSLLFNSEYILKFKLLL